MEADENLWGCMEEIPNDPCGTRYPELPIVVTGGVPRNDITEARAMKD